MFCTLSVCVPVFKFLRLKWRYYEECFSSARVCACRSRLADFHTTCQMTGHSINSCPHDNYHGCLMAYVGLIGSDVTPNYMDSSPSNSTISPWCSCRGTGNQEQECDAFLRDFTHNTCLKNSIQAFGYGSEGSVLPVTESLAKPFPPIQPPLNSKPAPSLQANDIKPLDSACVFSTCANLKDGGQKCIPSNDFECEEALLAQGSMDSEGEEEKAQRSAAASGPLGVRGCVIISNSII
ncbi:unnamed protein product [Oncorhynchus mykiss]|uniref:GDNF/GAS1 domain-containing protein n=1 Tax=Oncorhynchus mykiss TaxID=8022 RepID=A0A060Y0V9_ONCMY|nr:unnamed protein product [Oncorhynchus mykiss]